MTSTATISADKLVVTVPGGPGADLTVFSIPIGEARNLEQAIRRAMNQHEGAGNKRWQAALKAAHESYAREGETEFDDDVVVSDGGDEGGAYVASWTWVEFEEPLDPDGNPIIDACPGCEEPKSGCMCADGCDCESGDAAEDEDDDADDEESN